MKNKRVGICVLFLLGFDLIGLQAQDVLSTAGGNASGSGGTSSYTIGQIFYTTNLGSNGSIFQGVQLPYEISVVTGYEEYRDIHLKCFTYPNPTTDLVKLRFENYSNEKFFFKLYDNKGKLLINKKINLAETDINLGDFAPSVYYLKIYGNNKEIKTFKIIKY